MSLNAQFVALDTHSVYDYSDMVYALTDEIAYTWLYLNHFEVARYTFRQLFTLDVLAILNDFYGGNGDMTLFVEHFYPYVFEHLDGLYGVETPLDFE